MPESEKALSPSELISRIIDSDDAAERDELIEYALENHARYMPNYDPGDGYIDEYAGSAVTTPGSSTQHGEYDAEGELVSMFPVGQDKFPQSYRTATLDDFVQGQPDSVLQFVQFARRRQPCDLLICGENGTGKTHLATALSKEWRAWLWLDAPTYVEMARRDEWRAGGAWQRVTNLPLIVLDDITAVHMTNYSASTIRLLIDARMRNRRATIVTTHHDLAKIRSDWDSSLASRLSSFKPVLLGGPDRRAAK